MTFSYSQTVTYYSPNYFDRPTNDYDPLRLLEYESIVFEVCEEDYDIQEISSLIRCDDTTSKVNMIKASKGCYVGKVDVLSCDKGELEVEYNLDGKKIVYQKEVYKTDESKVVDYVLSKDYTDIDDPLELSYYLVVHNKVKEKDDEVSVEIYDKLKNLRNNKNKCWPSNNCDIDLTAEILYNLILAGYDENVRLIEDGRLYLNSQVREVSNSNGDVRVEFDLQTGDNTTCTFYADSDLEENETFNVSINFSKVTFSDNFTLECSQSINSILFIIDDPNNGDTNITLSDETSFSYKIVDNLCYGRTSCSFKTTMYALLTYNEDLQYHEELMDYIDSHIYNYSDEMQYAFSQSNFLFSSMYLEHEDSELVGNFVKFSQNNEGSWGSSSDQTKRVEQTFWGFKGITNVDKFEEYESDARNWMYFDEPEKGWGDLKRNTLAYITIEKYIRPFLVMDYDIVLAQPQKVSFENPSIFPISNVELVALDSFEDYVYYTQSLNEIGPQEEVEVLLNATQSVVSRKKGEFEVYGVIDGERKLLHTFPIVLVPQDLFVELEYETVFFSENSLDFKLPVEKLVDQEFDCVYTNSFNDDSGTFTFDSNRKTISFLNDEKISGTMEVTLKCSLEEEEFEHSFQVNIEEVKSTIQIINETLITQIGDLQAESIVVSSTYNEVQKVDVELQGPLAVHLLVEEPVFYLSPGDRKTMTFSILDQEAVASLANTSLTVRLVSDSGYIKIFDFEYTHQLQQEASTPVLTVLIIVIVTLSVLLLSLLLFRFMQSRKAQSQDTQGDIIDDELDYDFDELDLN